MCMSGPSPLLPQALPIELTSLSVAVRAWESGHPGVQLPLYMGERWAREIACAKMALHPWLWWSPGVRVA